MGLTSLGGALRRDPRRAEANGGNGGSGIVVIRYLTGTAGGSGGTITYAGGYTIHTFTSSGTFTIGPAPTSTPTYTPTNTPTSTSTPTATPTPTNPPLPTPPPASVFTNAAFKYDGDGKRVRSDITTNLGTTTTYFVGNHYEVTDGVVTKYYYAGAQRIAMRNNGTLFFLLGDHLGSTSLVTFGNGNVVSETRYKAWGEVRYDNGTTTTDYTYTGQYSYASDFGLMFYNARWYDSYITQFSQPDSIIPDPSNSQDWNRYAYARNNPLRYTDPTGHFSENAIKHYLKDRYKKNWEFYWDEWNKDKYWMDLLYQAQGGDVLMMAGKNGPIYFQFSGEGSDSLTGVQLVNDIVGTEVINPDAGDPFDYNTNDNKYHPIGLFYTENGHLKDRYMDPRVNTFDLHTLSEAEGRTNQFGIGMVFGLPLLPANPMIALIASSLFSAYGSPEVTIKAGGNSGDDYLFAVIVNEGEVYSAATYVRNGAVINSSTSYTPPLDLPNVDCGTGICP